MKKFIGLLFLGLFSGNSMIASDGSSQARTTPEALTSPIAVSVVPPIAPSRPCVVFARRARPRVDRAPGATFSGDIYAGHTVTGPTQTELSAFRVWAAVAATAYGRDLTRPSISSASSSRRWRRVCAPSSSGSASSRGRLSSASSESSWRTVSTFPRLSLSSSSGGSRSTSSSVARASASSVDSPVRQPRQAVDL